jgi:hypothetical protein
MERGDRDPGAAQAGAGVVKLDLCVAVRLRPVLTELDGLSLRTAARELERRGIATVRGGKWTAGLVSTARKRLSLPTEASGSR